MSKLEERAVPRTCTLWGADVSANDAVIMRWGLRISLKLALGNETVETKGKGVRKRAMLPAQLSSTLSLIAVHGA